MFEGVIKDVHGAMYASMVRGIILYHAHHLRLLTTYGAIASATKTLPRGGQLAQALALITEDDFKAKRPLSTAVVVSTDRKIPGTGFFQQCRELGLNIPRTDEDEDIFWKRELARMGVAPFTLTEMVDDPNSQCATFVRELREASEDPDFRVVKTFKAPARSRSVVVSDQDAVVAAVHDEASPAPWRAPRPAKYLMVPGKELRVGDVVVLRSTSQGESVENVMKGANPIKDAPDFLGRLQKLRKSRAVSEEEVVVTSVETLNRTHGEGGDVLWRGGGRAFSTPTEGVHLKIKARQEKTAEPEAEPFSSLPR